MDFNNYETLAQHCKRHGISVSRARRIARKSGINGVTLVKPFDRYVIAKNAPPIELPEPRTHAAARADGRQRYTV